jgi:hypothetical protein
MSDFTVEIDKWVKKAKANADLATRAIALALLERVQELTPVDTGRLRASFQIEPPIGEVTADEPVDIVTNVEYARRIEYGFVGKDSLGRQYDQPGHGMVAQTVAEAPAIAKRVLAGIKP